MCTYTHSSTPKYTVQDVATMQGKCAPGKKKKFFSSMIPKSQDHSKFAHIHRTFFSPLSVEMSLTTTRAE